MTNHIFRFLVVGSLVLGLAGAFLDAAFPALLHEAFHQAQQLHDSSLSTVRMAAFVVIGMTTVGALLAATYGLYRFRPWSPRLALFTTFVSLLLWPLAGASAQSGWSYVLSELSAYLWGAAVVVSNLPPFHSQFGRGEG